MDSKAKTFDKLWIMLRNLFEDNYSHGMMAKFSISFFLSLVRVDNLHLTGKTRSFCGQTSLS